MAVDTHIEALYPANSRFEEIQQIFQYVHQGLSCQLLGLPGVGRTNVLELLTYNRNVRIQHVGAQQTSYHFVLINFPEVKNRPFPEIIKFIFLELLSSLQERELDTETPAFLETLFQKSTASSDQLILMQGLKDAIHYLSHEKRLHVILLFERFETYIPYVTEEFFTYLFRLRELAKYSFSVVFSVNRPLEQIVSQHIIQDFQEFFEGHTIFIKLSDPVSLTFRTQYLEQLTKQKIPSSLQQSIVDLTGGHGRLTKLCLETYIAHSPQEKNMSEFFLSQPKIQTAVLEIWNFLSFQEKQDVIQGKTSSFLEQIELIKNNSITIPLFTMFINQHKAELLQKEQVLTYHSTTHTIMQGSTNISEKLTSAEFQLLKLLLEHKNEIVDRAMIIENVWGANASTAGVSDQAIDQLVFRLRQKVDKNNQHIQTIKGRGVKFN